MDGLLSASVGFIRKHLVEGTHPTQSYTPTSTNEVAYNWREYHDSTDPCSEPFEDGGNVAIPRQATVGGLRSTLPAGGDYVLRFLTEGPDGKFWSHAQTDSDPLPRYRGRCIAQVIRLPVSAKTVVQKAHHLNSSIMNPVPERKSATGTCGTLLTASETRSVTKKVAHAMAQFSQKSADDETQKVKKAAAQIALSDKFDVWSTHSGKIRDVRTLLGTIDSVIWPESGWSTVSVGELMMSEAAVKKAWRKAIIICHPDRHQSASVEQQYAADRIFGAVNDAFKVYSSKH